jgi:hypothetical protein
MEIDTNTLINIPMNNHRVTYKTIFLDVQIEIFTYADANIILNFHPVSVQHALAKLQINSLE